MKKEEKLIIFDMDGTLIDSGSVITNTINYVRSKFNLQPIAKEIMLENLNDPTINSAKFFYGTEAFTDEQRVYFTEYYDVHCISDIVLYDGIYELLSDLSKRYVLGVATNANSVYAHKMLDFLEIKKFFSLIVGADMVNSPKPSGDMLRYSLEKLQINKTNAILIGDSKKDLYAANDCDMDSILVDWGFTTFSNEEKIVIKDIKSLKLKIDEIMWSEI